LYSNVAILDGSVIRYHAVVWKYDEVIVINETETVFAPYL